MWGYCPVSAFIKTLAHFWRYHITPPYTFEYNEAGRLVRTTNVDGAGNELGSSELRYVESRCIWVNRNALGAAANHGVDECSGKHLVSTSSFDNENRLRNVKTFEYSGGRLVKSDSLYYLPDGTMYEHWLADHDSEGGIEKTYGLKADGAPLGDGKYRYEIRPRRTPQQDLDVQ